MKYFFEDKIKNIPICVELVEKYPLIKNELLNYIDTPEAFYQPKKTDDKSILENNIWKDSENFQTYWKSTPFSIYNGDYIDMYCSKEVQDIAYLYKDRARKACPVLNSIVKDLEQEGILANSFISRILPGTIIPPHYGRTDKWLRVHLGIICDPECKITIGSESKAWEEGKLLSFIDGPPMEHSVRHNGVIERVIFSIDLSREYVRKMIN